MESGAKGEGCRNKLTSQIITQPMAVIPESEEGLYRIYFSSDRPMVKVDLIFGLYC